MQSDRESESSSSWSLVDNQGQLIDSDEYSISESEPASEVARGPFSDDDNLNASDFHCISDDGDTDMTDVEETEPLLQDVEEVNSNEIDPVIQDNPLVSGDFFSLDIKTNRRIQIFAFASILSVVLMTTLFGDLFGIHQLRNYCYSKTSEPLDVPIRKFDQPIFDSDVFRDAWRNQVDEDESSIMTKEDLFQCHQDLNDAIKTASSNSVLMRYMRSKNSKLETLVQELKSFVELQRKEIESLEQKANVKQVMSLQSTSSLYTDSLCSEQTTPVVPVTKLYPNAPLKAKYPCSEESNESLQRTTPIVPVTKLYPNDKYPCSEETDNKENSPNFQDRVGDFFPNFSHIFNNFASFANSTALSLFVNSRPELVKFTNWLQKKTLKVLPKMIEQSRLNWRLKLRSYIKKATNALASPAITSLTKSRGVVGAIKKNIKSVLNHLSKSAWLQDDVCSGNTTCDLLMEFGNYLAEDNVFRGNLTPKQADSYVEFLKHIPPRQCTANSTLIACERCWWVGKCDGIKKKCNLRRWQRLRKIDPKVYIDGNPKVNEIFKKLGWVDAKDLIVHSMSEPLGPPRYKKGKHVKNDWLLRRSAKRAEHRQRSSESSWFFDRHAQRKALRNSEQASDWLFERGSHRAALRQN